MNQTEYLLGCLAEECAEVGQVCSKIQRFGWSHEWKGRRYDNLEKLRLEFTDLIGVADMLHWSGYPFMPYQHSLASDEGIYKKQAKMERLMKLSEQLGCLTGIRQRGSDESARLNISPNPPP